jgi:MFS family permease
MTISSKTNRHVTLLASLGSTLEYYDFVIYAMMATYLSVVFFPPQDASAAVLQSFLVFAVGYFARPLGGTIIGMIGDRFGRRPAFLISTTLMATSTLMIALLPSYEAVGGVAILLLAGCRILQGISFGGELAGAMTIVSEFSTEHRKGRGTSLVMASTSLGALLASGVLYALTTLLTKEDIVSWGWRLPFLSGGILGLALLVARNTIQETPVFQAFQQKTITHKPLINLLKTHKLSLLKGTGLTAFMAAMILTNLYFPYFIPKFYGYEPQAVFLGSTISLIFVALIFPFMGMFVDYLRNRTKTVRWTCFLYMALSIPSYMLLSNGDRLSLVSFLIIQQIFIALFASAFFPILLRLFSPDVRYTGVALCYNVTWAALATLPIGFTALLDLYAHPLIVPLILSTIAGLSLLATWSIAEGTSDTL